MSQKKKEEASISVPSKDASDSKKDKDDNDTSPNPLSGIDEPKDPKNKKDSKKSKKKQENELSAEDEELKKRLSELVIGILDSDYLSVAQPALNLLKTEIRSSTSSMTSVPKPLKFLKNDYEKIKIFYNKLNKTDSGYMEYSDLMSILAMTMEEPQTRLCLKY
eukprot:122004_1